MFFGKSWHECWSATVISISNDIYVIFHSAEKSSDGGGDQYKEPEHGDSYATEKKDEYKQPEQHQDSYATEKKDEYASGGEQKDEYKQPEQHQDSYSTEKKTDEYKQPEEKDEDVHSASHLVQEILPGERTTAKAGWLRENILIFVLEKENDS